MAQLNKRICQVKHDPPHTYGDCIAACIRTLIDSDEVPNYFTDQGAEWAWSKTRDWLAERGKFIFLVEVEDPWLYMEVNNAAIPMILLGQNSEGVDHCVITRNGVIVHDPAWYKNEMVGPLSTTNSWIVGVIGDLV